MLTSQSAEQWMLISFLADDSVENNGTSANLLLPPYSSAWWEKTLLSWAQEMDGDADGLLCGSSWSMLSDFELLSKLLKLKCLYHWPALKLKCAAPLLGSCNFRPFSIKKNIGCICSLNHCEKTHPNVISLILSSELFWMEAEEFHSLIFQRRFIHKIMDSFFQFS